MFQVNGNPTRNETLSLTTYEIVSTDASGYVNLSADATAITTGNEMILTFDGGDAQGYVDGQTYYNIPVSGTVVRLASTKSNAKAGVSISGDVSGDAGAGDLYPTYHVGGTLFIGTGGTMNIRGISEATNFSIHENIDNGTLWPFMVEWIHSWAGTGNTNVSDVVAWYE